LFKLEKIVNRHTVHRFEIYLLISYERTIILALAWSKQKWLFWGPAFFQPIRVFWKLLRLLWFAG